MSADTARILLIGLAATAVMDLWLAALKRLGVPTLDFALLGRWIGHLARGQWRHEAIAKAPSMRGESAWGWLAHYAIGVAFAALLVALQGVGWMAQPTLLPAVGVGLATVLAPWLLLQPAMGAGIASSKTRTPTANRLRSLASHAVFGVGLYLAAVGLQWCWPVSHAASP